MRSAITGPVKVVTGAPYIVWKAEDASEDYPFVAQKFCGNELKLHEVRSAGDHVTGVQGRIGVLASGVAGQRGGSLIDFVGSVSPEFGHGGRAEIGCQIYVSLFYHEVGPSWDFRFKVVSYGIVTYGLRGAEGDYGAFGFLQLGASYALEETKDVMDGREGGNGGQYSANVVTTGYEEGGMVKVGEVR